MSHAQTVQPAESSARAARHNLSFWGIVRSEWLKLWSVRSTWWTLAILIVVSLGLVSLVVFSIAQLSSSGGEIGLSSSASPDDQLRTVLQLAASGVSSSALVASILGALVVTGEYATGAIRSTYLAVPRRWPVLLAKALVLAIVVGVIGLITTYASYLIASTALSKVLPDQAGFNTLVVSVIGGGALYLLALALIAAHLGAIVRSTAGAIAVAVGLVLVAPIVLAILTGLNVDWAFTVLNLLPSTAGDALITPQVEGATLTVSDHEPLTAWQGAITLGAWVVVTGAIAWFVTLRRDV